MKKIKCYRSTACLEEDIFKVSSRSDALVSLWSLRTVFGFPNDFIADFPWYGRGGEWSKYERVERGGGQKKLISLASTLYIYIIKFS